MEMCPDLSAPSLCRSGTCGTCACRVSDPTAIEQDDESQVDSEKRKAGWALSCTAHVIKPNLTVESSLEDEYNLA